MSRAAAGHRSGSRPALWLLLGVLVASCASGAPARPEPPDQAAIDAFAEVAAIERGIAVESEPEVTLTDLQRAWRGVVDADPTWITSQRELDEVERLRLLGPSVWERRRRAAAAADATAAELYLLARLEGADGVEAFRRALRIDASASWPHHALSIDAELAGDRERALELQRGAVERAREGFERQAFGWREVQLLDRLDRDDQALEALEQLVDASDDARLTPRALPLQLEFVDRLMDANSPTERERGVELAIELVERYRLSDAELSRLIGSVGGARGGHSREDREARLVAALRRGPRSPALDDPASLLARSITDLRLALRGPTGGTSVRGHLRRGEFVSAAELWLRGLPRVALRDDGLPRDGRLRRWVELASRSDAADDQRRLELAEALLDAGRTDLAEPLLDDLAESARAGELPTEPVLALDRRRVAIDAILSELDLAIGSLFDGRLSFALTPPDEEGGLGDRPDGTREVLAALQRVFERHAADAGLSAPDVAAVGSSPLLRFGPFASIAVPGPRFGERDVLYGVGRAGEPVPGLAALMDELGRFGLFGAGAGRPADGTVLRKLWAEERSGEHLGRRWSGTVVWCDGADADGARSRGTAAVGGAALHEGYWIDVAAIRAQQERYARLTRVFDVDGERPEALTQELPQVDPALEGSALRAERRRLVPALGEGERLALTLLYERRAADPNADVAELVDLEDLLELVEVHEEGHLCDRERFLPLGRNLGGLIALGLGELLAGDLGIERRLEYRAQAVALASVSDPRLALVDLLDAAEVDARIESVHPRAYTALLEDVLLELDQQLELAPDAFPQLDPRGYLLYQLRLLDPEQLRRVAVGVARSEGLTAD